VSLAFVSLKVPTRSLREELSSVFSEALATLQALGEAEAKLETLTNEPDLMQNVRREKRLKRKQKR
jgi:hypothetical protein